MNFETVFGIEADRMKVVMRDFLYQWKKSLSEVRLGSARHLLMLRVHPQEFFHLLWRHVPVKSTLEVVIGLFLDIRSVLESLYELILLFLKQRHLSFDFHSTVIFFQDLINKFVSLIESLLSEFLCKFKKCINNYVKEEFLTYHLLSLFSLHLLLPNHFLNAIILHVFLFFLKCDNLLILLTFLFQTLSLVNLAHLFFLEILINGGPLVLFLLIVGH